MNKGMIMEVKKSYAIALNDEGIMDKIAYKQNMEVGQKIFYFEDDIVKATTSRIHKHNNFIKTIGSIAALFLLVFTFFNTIKYEQAYAVVSLDINPSIQIEADSKQRIIKVEGINDDGKNIDFADIKDVSLDEGIQRIKEKLVEKKYLDTNNEVLVGVFIKNGDNTSYEEDLQKTIRSTFNTEDITFIKADEKEVDEAKKECISIGRYTAKETISDNEEAKNNMGKAPVKEITALIKDKENVIQWEAKDEKVDEANEKPEVKKENPGTDANSNVNANTNTNASKDKPIINVPSDNQSSNTEKEKDNNTKQKNNDVLEVEPEVPVAKEKDKNQKPAEDKSINIAPDSGSIKNNTTSGKIQEEVKTDKIAPVEPKTGVTNNTTKN